MRAKINILDSANYLLPVWRRGVQAAGYRLCDKLADPQPDDLLIIWNRRQNDEQEAKRFEAAGATVLVAENGYLGKWWNGHKWFALSQCHHNGAGWIPYLPSRWDRYAVELAPWREAGGELVALPQRGIGEVGVAMPRDWKPPVPCRVRPHRGIHETLPLEDDLANASAVITWGSGAAIKALLMGIPCFHAFQNWIGRDSSTLITPETAFDKPWRGDRLVTFQRVLSGMWTASEIENGEAIWSFKREDSVYHTDA